MKKQGQIRKTTVGAVDSEVLSFTVGKDPQVDLVLAESDCIGSAAHVAMLSRMNVKPRLFTDAERRKVVAELVRIMERVRDGKFKITRQDQDVHMAVERELTERLGDLGRKVHTGRSRNDQVAVDLRLHARGQILGTIEEAAGMAGVLLDLAIKHRSTPMVGRTHLQPAMPSSVGLWASAYAESLLDDIQLLRAAYDLNDRSPLGAAAGYGVPIPLDRELTSRLLGFRRPCHNVLHAINSRGKCESVIIFAMAQVMLSLSRLSADMILFLMPEFGYFTMPSEFCTGSSIMPQKQNPDVFELVKAKAASVLSSAFAVSEILRGLPGGYNRDLQETKAHFVESIAQTRASLRVVTRLMKQIRVNEDAMMNGFTPGVFATDRVLELVAKGTPFRAAYDIVKKDPGAAARMDPLAAIRRRTHLGAPAGLDFSMLRRVADANLKFAGAERQRYCAAISKLLGMKYAESNRPAQSAGV